MRLSLFRGCIPLTIHVRLLEIVRKPKRVLVKRVDLRVPYLWLDRPADCFQLQQTANGGHPELAGVAPPVLVSNREGEGWAR